jgi:sugar phosphate isomerase/epimerase
MKASEIAALEARIETLTAHIALAQKLEKPAIVALFTREIARIEETLAPARKSMEPKVAKTKTPCAWAKEIRRFFAIAKERGLDTKNDESMRRAFENFFFRPVASREELDGRDWAQAADAVKSNQLAW